MKDANKTVAVAIEPEDFRRLSAIAIRLYDGKTMSYDDRRELAAQISAILGRAEELQAGDVIL